MTIVKSSALAVAVALASSLASGLAAQANEGAGVEVGLLSCALSDRTNAVLYVNEEFNCVFNPANGEHEDYDGVIRRIGLDLEFKPEQTFVWAVVAPTLDVAKGALAGTYSGVSASASAGAGVGGKVLVGGFDESITLQPASVSGSTGGAGASVGVEVFELTAK